MPAKRLRLGCRHALNLVGLLLLVSAGVRAQSGGVTINGSISETVALSVVPNSTQGNVGTEVFTNGNTVRIILSGGPSEAPVIRVPLLVRSNTRFKITATVESEKVALTTLSVTDVRATGALVPLQAIAELNVPRQFDLRGLAERSFSTPNLPEDTRPRLVLSGPRVSLGGTLVSANNGWPTYSNDWKSQLLRLVGLFNVCWVAGIAIW